MSAFFSLLITVLIISSVRCYIEHPGPRVIATKGELWPKPQYQEKSDDYFALSPNSFRFQLIQEIDCPEFIQDVFDRYWNIIAHTSSLDKRLYQFYKSAKKPMFNDVNFLGYINILNVNLTGDCPRDGLRPDFDIVENYTLQVTVTNVTLTAPSIWGILRGIESFSQLVYLQDDTLLVNATIINDFPRFPHRGLLLDTSRHFIPVNKILDTLDAMAYNKLNVFHWHIVDDQSFPYRSIVYPQLSVQGAFHPVTKVYEQSDIKKVINYANARGIRVIPEFDTPGHTRSWGVAYPQLLTQCYTNNTPTNDYGPMDPTKNYTYEFLRTLFAEVVQVFPDSYFHIGGDEVEFDCWESNPDVQEFMTEHNFHDYAELESYFIQNVVDILNDLGSNYLAWEEVFVNGVQIPDNTVVHVWRDGGLETLANVTAAGKFGLYSSCWYLDHLDTGGDWQKYYSCEPLDFPGTKEQKGLVLGGEACMWSETVNEYNVISRVWPRASAAAERLWSSIDTNNSSTAAHRLEEHTCRMNRRGIAAQPPNGPGVCLY